jgi:hypothetical protein
MAAVAGGNGNSDGGDSNSNGGSGGNGNSNVGYGNSDSGSGSNGNSNGDSNVGSGGRWGQRWPWQQWHNNQLNGGGNGSADEDLMEGGRGVLPPQICGEDK